MRNKVGSAEGQITLTVKDEEKRREGGEEEDKEEEKEATVQDSEKVELERFGEYVAEMHAKNNDGFELQFQV